jgi:hypothetical protein
MLSTCQAHGAADREGRPPDARTPSRRSSTLHAAGARALKRFDSGSGIPEVLEALGGNEEARLGLLAKALPDVLV